MSSSFCVVPFIHHLPQNNSKRILWDVSCGLNCNPHLGVCVFRLLVIQTKRARVLCAASIAIISTEALSVFPTDKGPKAHFLCGRVRRRVIMPNPVREKILFSSPPFFAGSLILHPSSWSLHTSDRSYHENFDDGFHG